MENNRYEGRETSQELNQLLYDKAMGFISEVSGTLASLGYKIEIAGSLAKGQAVHKKNGGWYVKDIDFRLSKNGRTLSPDEVEGIRTNEYLISSTKQFLKELQVFYSSYNISIGMLEVDFLCGVGRVGNFSISKY